MTDSDTDTNLNMAIAPAFDPRHDRARKRLGRHTRKGPDGVTLKPGRHVVDGRTHYDGTGPSGYTGEVPSRTPLLGTTAKRKIELAQEAKKKLPRVRRRRTRVENES